MTLVQGDAYLMNKTYPLKFRKALGRSVQDRGVKIMFNEYVDEFPTNGAQGEVTTRSGKKIEADLIVATNGPRPNTAFVSTLGADTLTTQGAIKVKPTLQLASHPTIYAAGDVIDWQEQKQAAKVAGHAGVIIANILSEIAGQTPTKQYKGSYELVVVTNGKVRCFYYFLKCASAGSDANIQDGGIAYFGVLWGIMLGNWFVKMVKSKGLLIPMARSSAGL